MSFFTVEKLKEIGLSDEQAQKIFSERGKEMAKYNDYEEIKQKYKEQGEQLSKLQELDPEKLKEQVDVLTKSHKEQIKEIENKHMENIKKMAIKMSLNDVHDPDIAMGLIDLSKVDVDDNGNVKMGLEEQLKSLRKDKSFLFRNDSAKVTAKEPTEGDKINEKDATDSFLKSVYQGAGLEGGK